MILASLLLLSLQADPLFCRNFEGLWGDIDGNFLTIDKTGISFISGERYVTVHSIEKNSNGDFYCKWRASKTVSASGVGILERDDKNDRKKKSTTLSYFVVGSPDTPQQSGDGLIKFGRPNSRGVIKSFTLDLKRTKGGSLLSSSYAYICPLSSLQVSGTYADDLLSMSVAEKQAEDSGDPLFRTVEGTLEFAGRKYIAKGNKKALGASLELKNPVTNAEEGNIFLIWFPTPGRVSDMFNTDSYETNRLQVTFNLKDKSLAPRTVRELKVKR